jgi:hypothetical protein
MWGGEDSRAIVRGGEDSASVRAYRTTKMHMAAQKCLLSAPSSRTILLARYVPGAWVQMEPLKGQRGSFGRQPSLAPSHEA